VLYFSLCHLLLVSFIKHHLEIAFSVLSFRVSSSFHYLQHLISILLQYALNGRQCHVCNFRGTSVWQCGKWGLRSATRRIPRICAYFTLLRLPTRECIMKLLCCYLKNSGPLQFMCIVNRSANALRQKKRFSSSSSSVRLS